MREQLGDRYPKIERIGCYIKRRTLNAAQVAAVFQKDLQTARTHTQNDPTGYFSRKARMIEVSMEKFKGQRDGRMYGVGYEPGLPYIYPGLPVEFAEFVDPAIRDVIDLAARCKGIAFTGLCCAGHPSTLVKNPYYLDNPRFTAIHRDKIELGPFLYSHNQSPYMTLLINNDWEGAHLVKELLKITAKAEGGIVRIESGQSNLRFHHIEFPRFVLMGSPRLVADELRFDDFVKLYKEALQEFWTKVQDVFESLGGLSAPKPAAEHFNGADVDLDWEFVTLKERIAKGRGIKPNYYYFFGNGSTVSPELAQND